MAFAAALVGGLWWTATWDGAADIAPAGTLAFARHFVHFGLWKGYGAGDFVSAPHDLAATALEPGDILLGANPHCVYGYWSHVTIVLDRDSVLGHDLCSGLYRAHLAECAGYRHLRVLRPRLPAAARAAAATRAAALIGEPFALAARRDDPRLWTCAKTIYAVYRECDFDLSGGETLVRPDAIAAAAGTAPVDVVMEFRR